jgi:adenylate kinase
VTALALLASINTSNFSSVMNHRYLCDLLIGSPGAGKGTQGKILGAIPRFFHCPCGDVFRALDLRSPLGRKFTEFSSKGLFIPDELTIELWQTTIDAQVKAMIFKPDIDTLVLDGIPHNLNQAKLMERLIDVRNAFHLLCPDREELIRRLRKRALYDNRLDDANETVIRRRLETYESEMRPVLDFYKDKLTTIDATQPPVKVVNDITTVIWSRLKSSAPGGGQGAATARRFEALGPADLVA